MQSISEWKEYKLSEFLLINPKVKLPSNQQISFVEMKDLEDGKRYCKPSSMRKLGGGAKFENNDTLFARITPCLENGKICQVKNLLNGVGLGSTEFLVFRGLPDVSDTNFIFYLCRWSEVRSHAELNLDGTSGRQRVPKECFNELVLPLPPLPEQKAIASVLGSLDDKIDLLHRQNTTLEQMAETLFRQWFIEEAKEDWEEVELSFFGTIICGKTPPKSNFLYFNGKFPFIKIPDMHGKTFVFNCEDSLTELGVQSQPNKTIPPDSICVSCIATVGLVVMNAKESQTNQQINTIIPSKEFFRFFIYLKMVSIKQDLLVLASGGTATDNLNTSNFSKIKIQKPSDYMLNDFHKKVNPWFNKIKSNQIQIQTLSTLRDTLLPKLMSGEVRVRE
jgi:type I restriction enzyme S subunit